jgi:NDP-sugar pyrophosphorylase family protein
VVRPLLVSLAVVISSPALAKDCVVSAGPHDRVERGKPVVVAAGESLENVVAIDGDVVLRRGAKVKSAVAVNGNVVLESGAKVTGTAATFGGKIEVAEGAKISGSRVQLSDGIHIRSENGKDVGLALSVGGEDLSNLLLAKLVEKARTCRIVTGSGEIQL